MVYHTDLRIGEVVYVFKSFITFHLDGWFQIYFFYGCKMA